MNNRVQFKLKLITIKVVNIANDKEIPIIPNDSNQWTLK